VFPDPRRHLLLPKGDSVLAAVRARKGESQRARCARLKVETVDSTVRNNWRNASYSVISRLTQLFACVRSAYVKAANAPS
jgi:hypothetical protein